MKLINGIVVSLIFSIQVFAQSSMNSNDLPPTMEVAEEDSKEFQKDRERALASADTVMPTPTREFSVIVTKEGYYPRRISLFAGEKLRLFVTNLTDEQNCLIVTGHNIFLAAQKGNITEGEALFDKPGVYPFYCPSSKFNGQITVIEKKKKIAIVRAIASEKSAPAVWMPKDR